MYQKISSDDERVKIILQCSRDVPPKARARLAAKIVAVVHEFEKENGNPDAEAARLTGTVCSVCGCSQFETPSGITCPNGHGGAPAAKTEEEDDG